LSLKPEGTNTAEAGVQLSVIWVPLDDVVGISVPEEPDGDWQSSVSVPEPSIIETLKFSCSPLPLVVEA